MKYECGKKRKNKKKEAVIDTEAVSVGGENHEDGQKRK